MKHEYVTAERMLQRINILESQQDELLEVACHEDNGDLEHLKDVRDEFRAQQKKEK